MIAHGAQKVLGSFEGPGLGQFIAGYSFRFHETNMVMAWRCCVFRVGWWKPRFAGSPHACGSVLYCLHNADRSRGSALARFFRLQPRYRISFATSGNVAGPYDFGRKNGVN